MPALRNKQTRKRSCPATSRRHGGAAKELRESVHASTFTVKDLQDVELLLGLEELEVQGDVVALLHTDHPRAHLLVGVVFREAWTQDHAGGVEQHLVVRATHWEKRKKKKK